MKIRKLGLIPAALIFLAPMAHADKATVTPEAQTRAALKRLGALYGPAWTLTYESVLTLKQFGPTSGTQSSEATVHGLLQKPNKFRLEVMQNDKLIGLLVSDGTTVSLYSPQLGVYHREAAPSDLALGSLEVPDKVFARIAAEIPVMAMTPTLFSLATRPDFLGTDATDFAATILTLHGRQALDCSWGEAGANEHILFNQTTGLPLRTIDSTTDKDGTTTQRQEDLTAVQIGSVPLPLSTFDWVPPSGAKAVAASASTAGKPAPAALPMTQTTAPKKVLRHRRRRTQVAPDTPGTDSGKTPTGKIIRPVTSQ